MKIRRTGPEDCNTVAALVYELLTELSLPNPVGTSFDDSTQITSELLQSSVFWALLAESDEGEAIGVLTLNECAAIYAGGIFGEITELFVLPAFRSQGTGKQLINAAIQFGKERGWKRLEVCTPRVPPWERSLAFYQENAFVVLGPRLKLPLS